MANFLPPSTVLFSSLSLFEKFFKFLSAFTGSWDYMNMGFDPFFLSALCFKLGVSG